MRTAVGGTFNKLHRGHKVLLEKAFSGGGEVLVGISSDEFAGGRKELIVPLEERKECLENYLSSNFDGWEIDVLEDEMGSTIEDESIEALVVTPDNYSTGERINRVREERGMDPLELVLVAYVLAGDFLPISSSRILSGEIDDEGRLFRPLKVVVGSENPVKVNAVRSVMEILLEEPEIHSICPDSNVDEQPFHDDVIQGAKNRALSALEKGDIGVGIEAGVFEMDDGLYDVQYCVIADKGNWMTMGHGSGFRYPPGISRLVRSGKTVSEAFHSLYDIKDIGKKEGAIGYLTKGNLTRQNLTEQAVMAAMVPRIRKDVYRDI